MKSPIFFLALCLFSMPTMGVAAPSCSEHAEKAAAKHEVPADLMSAIALVETQRGGRSWPWTLNEGGKSHYFATKGEALTYLQDAVARGVRNIDVGCMQLNFRWHAAGFSSLEAMLDPQKNTNYAALFLLELKKRLGSWEEATKHYHSSDEERGTRYRDKVVDAATRLKTGKAPNPSAPRTNENAQAAADTLAPLGSLIEASDDRMTSLYSLASRVNVPSDDPESRSGMRKVSELPPRLRRRWDEVEAMRDILASSD